MPDLIDPDTGSLRKLDNLSTPPALIDLSQVLKWRRICQNTHGDCCNDRYSEVLALHMDNLILVDVITNSLVTRPTTTPFVALSYVWGNVPVFKTQKANFEALQEPGALLSDEVAERLPETIRDAMYLVKCLEERYLWVDCLCIIQDTDTKNMDGMLRGMASIYASAEFTIAVANGPDAKHGIRGIGGPAQRRKFAEAMAMQDYERGADYPWDSIWASRGWTFQESLFSRRLLIFNNVMTWICGRCEWYEDHAPKQHGFSSDILANEATSWPLERPHLGVPMGMMSLIPKFPSLGRWGMLIQNFSSRSLTFENDIDRAFAGATEIMSSTFPGGIIFGLPVFFFDIALLWQPLSTVTRRSEEPSWSWMGWKGRVDTLCHWHPFFAGVYRDSGNSYDWVAMSPLRPVARYQLYKAPTQRFPSLETSNEHFNGFYKYQALRADPIAALPPSWTRHYHTDGDYYTTNTEQYESFKYAFPLPLVTLTPQPDPVPLSPILHCTAPRAVVQLGMTIPECPGERPGFTMLMHKNQFIGAIFVNNPDAFDQRKGAHCELVAISQATVLLPEALAEQGLTSFVFEQLTAGNKDFARSMNDSKWDYYNVLWIGWHGDSAYRKGLGIANKMAWDALNAETITFKLG